MRSAFKEWSMRRGNKSSSTMTSPKCMSRSPSFQVIPAMAIQGSPCGKRALQSPEIAIAHLSQGLRLSYQDSEGVEGCRGCCSFEFLSLWWAERLWRGVNIEVLRMPSVVPLQGPAACIRNTKRVTQHLITQVGLSGMADICTLPFPAVSDKERLWTLVQLSQKLSYKHRFWSAANDCKCTALVLLINKQPWQMAAPSSAEKRRHWFSSCCRWLP